MSFPLTHNSSSQTSGAASPAPEAVVNRSWRQSIWLDVVLLIALFCVSYLPRLNDLPLRGEETRRARIAWEMQQTGNYAVPMLQGEPRLIKPPFHNWMIDLSAQLSGGYSRFSIRLPSLVSVLAVALLLYGYGTSFLGRKPALASSLVWLTMGQVLQLGRLAESDTLFAALFSSCLIIWHWGETSKQSLWTWPLAYLLASAAFLTKGIQVPVYLCGTIGVFLILSRKWMRLLSVSHLLAIATTILALTPWTLAFLDQLGWDGLHTLYLGEVGERVNDRDWGKFFGHLVELPLEVFGASLFPWSPLLLAYLSPAIRRDLFSKPQQKELILFCAIAFGIAWPTVWLPVNSSTRYLLPVYPFVALLIGCAVGQLWSQATDESLLSTLWKRNVVLFGVVITIAATAGIGYSVWQPYSPYAQPLWQLILALGLGLMLIVDAQRKSPRKFSTQSRLYFQSALMIVLTVGMMQGPFLNVLINRSPHAEQQIAQLKSTLVDSKQLISFGLLHHLFLYHFEDEVLQVAWPDGTQISTEFLKPGDYFCFHHKRMDRELPELPFGWKLIEVINCDRTIKTTPYDLVVVGQRTDTPVTEAPRIARWSPLEHPTLSSR